MDKETSSLVDVGMAWCGPVFVLMYAIFWGIMGDNIPPPNAMGLTAEELVNGYYLSNQTTITIGMAVSAFVGIIYLPWSCLLAMMMRNKQGQLTVLSFLQLTGGVLTSWLLAFCPTVWLACAVFATEVDPSVIKMLHTWSWFIYDMTFTMTTAQCLGIGLYVILDKTSHAIFPAWTGWAAVATGVGFATEVLLPFVSSGPFTISGAWNYYVVFGTWLFLFFSVFSYYMLKEVSRQRREILSEGVPSAV